MPRLLPEITTTNVVKMAGVTSLVALLAATFVTVFSYDQRVTLDVDGVVTELRTTSDTVSELLADEGVTLAADDTISMSTSSELDDGDTIVVRTAKPLTLVVDGKVSQNVVHAWNVSDALDDLNVEPQEGAHIAPALDQRITTAGTSLVVSNPKKVTIKADGKKRTVTTNEPTVADVFAAEGIEVDSDDEIKPGLGAYVKPNQALRLVRIEKVVRTETLHVDFKVDVTQDSSMFQGERTIVTEGQRGADKAKVELILADGKVRERTVISRSSIRPPITQVEKRGTKERPIDGGVWDRLAKCESGGNWSINTGNGFYGGLQFSAATWRSVGGSGLPHQNSKAEQIKRGKILQQRAGWGQWPACTKRLGLR